MSGDGKYDGAISSYLKNYRNQHSSSSSRSRSDSSNTKYSRLSSYNPKYAEEAGLKVEETVKRFKRPTSSRSTAKNENDEPSYYKRRVSSRKKNTDDYRTTYIDDNETNDDVKYAKRGSTASTGGEYHQATTPFELLQQEPVLKLSGYKIKKYVEREPTNIFVLPREGTRGVNIRGFYKNEPTRDENLERRERTHHYQEKYHPDPPPPSIQQTQQSTHKTAHTARGRPERSQKMASRNRSSSTAGSSSHAKYKPQYQRPDARYHDVEDDQDEYMEFSSESNALNSARSSHSHHSSSSTSKPASITEPSNPATAQGWDNSVPEYQEVTLAPCSICGRKFNADRLEKHKKICSKNTNKKRKVFNSKKHRQDTEAKQLDQTTTRRGKIEEERRKAREKNKLPKWKQQHLEFQSVVKAGSNEEVAIPVDTRVPCPHCHRKFSETVAERHIPRCANIRNRPKPFRRR